MTKDEAFRLINNLDWEEKTRRFAPQWSLVTYSRKGVIEDITRLKERPQITDQTELMKRFPKSLQFTSYQGQLQTAKQLEQKIRDSIKTLALVEAKENQGKRWIQA